MNYLGKQVAVLGMGRSGEAAALLLVGLGASVSLLDDTAPTEKLQQKVEMFRGMGVKIFTGKESALEAGRGAFDLAVLSPGIDPRVLMVQNLIRRGVPVIAEIELAYQSCACPLVGITGTNGKTTTTELVFSMLTQAGVATVAGGNIGKPFSEIVNEGTGDFDLITLEVSSFQLERIRQFRPAISVWLNLAPDHLDRYTSAQEYRASKLRIFENQTLDDYAIVNFRDNLPALAAKRMTFSAYEIGGDLDLRDDVIHYKGAPLLDQRDTGLRGRHNTENLMAALGVGLAHGLTAAQMKPGLCAYRPAPHRCEVVRDLGGVIYINDSKATNIDALEKAILAIDASRPIVLVAGGKDKGFPYDSITTLVKARARWVVLIGEMAGRIAEAWGQEVPCERAQSLEEAVRIAWSIAQAGDTVLFSPGTSSFDMFKNYAERGDRFRQCVLDLPV